MSQVDDENILSEAEGRAGDSDNLRLVPVAESIRYRKRAQGAEKQVESLTEQLAQAKSQETQLQKELDDVRVEQKLVRKLVSAGTVDLEAAVLIAKTRIDGSDLDGMIEQLKKEKRYLFGNGSDVALPPQRTAGAKDRMTGRHTILETAAKRAATTGNRTDLHEYLRLRRNFL